MYPYDLRIYAMRIFNVVFAFVFLLMNLGNAQAQQDPNNLFLVDVENVYNVSMAGKKLEHPSVGDRALSAEEVLMYEVLNCKWDSGKWLRYTANPAGKGSIKVGHPFIDKNGTRIFFTSDIKGGAGGFDIYYSEKRNGSWTDPTNLGIEVNSPEDEMFPFITGAGVLQIYRGSTQANFDIQRILGETSEIVAQQKPVTQTPVQEKSQTPAVIQEPVKSKPVESIQEKVEEKVESVQEAVTQPATNEIEYRVQIGSFSSPNWSVLNQLSDLGSFQTMQGATGLTSVHLGSFSTLEEAKQLAERVKLRPGFGNAYVVSVKDNKVLGIHR